MKKCLATLSTAVLLAACTGTTVETAPISIHPLEQNAINALSLNLAELADTQLVQALSHYQTMDDLEGQWRIRRRMALVELARPDLPAAQAHAHDLDKLAKQINTNPVHFGTKVILGRTTGQMEYFTEAQRHATTPVEEAVILAYLGDTAGAVKKLDSDESPAPADKAFIFYRHAQMVRSASAFHTALEAYRVAKDSRGIADSLMSLARLAADDGKLASARAYAERASSVLEASGDTQRAQRVQTWLNSL